MFLKNARKSEVKYRFSQPEKRKHHQIHIDDVADIERELNRRTRTYSTDTPNNVLPGLSNINYKNLDAVFSQFVIMSYSN